MNSDVTSKSAFLVLQLDNELPFSLADLASLYAELARDYRKYSRGHELTIVKISEGSLISIFKDAIDFASGSNTLISFGKAIAGLLSVFSKESQADRPKDKWTGARTVEKLAQIAVKSKSGVQIKYSRDSEREEILIVVPPATMKKVQEQFDKATTMRSSKRKARITKGSDSLGYLADISINKAGMALSRLAERAAASKQPDESDTQLLVDGFVGILISRGLTHILSSVADDLERRGMVEAAELVRDATYRATGGNDPPQIPRT
jgi:hypothetical protein